MPVINRREHDFQEKIIDWAAGKPAAESLRACAAIS
jgi:hypothetical protein